MSKMISNVDHKFCRTRTPFTIDNAVIISSKIGNVTGYNFF